MFRNQYMWNTTIYMIIYMMFWVSTYIWIQVVWDRSALKWFANTIGSVEHVTCVQSIYIVLIYMNTDATYWTRRQRVRGAVNGFIWHRGFTGENHVSEEPSSGSQEKIGFELIFWKSAKIDAKNLPTKIAMLTLKTCCDAHGWPFSNLRTDICSREQA